MAKKQDVDALFQAVDRMCVAFGTKERRAAELLDHARRATRHGADTFGRAVSQRLLEESTNAGDRTGRWLAAGVYGHLLERQGDVDGAIKLWSEVFAEGSDDADTVNRLSMQLDRKKAYDQAISVVNEALKRSLPANVEEQLRKRLARCQEKSGGRSGGTQKATKKDVPAFSVRLDQGRLELMHQVRVRPPIKDLEILSGIGRCMGVAKKLTSLVDIELATGKELRRINDLPEFDDTAYLRNGWGIATKRTARLGEGPTHLWFLDPDGRVVGEESIPDAASQIAPGGDRWFVGCRDGRLYGYTPSGERLWTWVTPGADKHEGDAYSRPCPYYVASSRRFSVVASMENLYAVDPGGKSLWHARLPNEKETQWTVSIPLGRSGAFQEAHATLGLTEGASQEEAKSAYRRLALATHPDRNPEDPQAAAKFREIHGAYEAILYGRGEGGGSSVEFTVELVGFGPTASFLAANDNGVVVGSSQGRIYRFDDGGRMVEARALGDSYVFATQRPDGSLAAAWCDGAAFFFRGTEVINSAPVSEVPRGMSMFGDDLLLWRRNRLELMDPMGRPLWIAEFSKSITSVEARSNHLICAAGVLAIFRRA